MQKRNDIKFSKQILIPNKKEKLLHRKFTYLLSIDHELNLI